MKITVFSVSRGSKVIWLCVNDDGSVTYHEEYSDPLAPKQGRTRQERTMSVDEAIKDWRVYAAEIAEAHKVVSKVGRLN